MSCVAITTDVLIMQITHFFVNGKVLSLEYLSEHMSKVMYKIIIKKCNTYIHHPDKRKFHATISLFSIY